MADVTNDGGTGAESTLESVAVDFTRDEAGVLVRALTSEYHRWRRNANDTEQAWNRERCLAKAQVNKELLDKLKEAFGIVDPKPMNWPTVTAWPSPKGKKESST